jgi:hypothetical protein
MAVYELKQNGFVQVTATTFKDEQLDERGDLQRLLRDQIGIICPDTETMVLAEEFSSWDESARRIDLLGLDRDANLVIIELKRTEDGGHMELQAIRYAAMVSQMTFDQAVEAREKYSKNRGTSEDSRQKILEFLDWSEPQEDQFNQDVRIVLASAEFSKEITTAVLWLNDRDLDIRCMRLKPYKLDNRILVDVQQIIPPPEAAEFQIRIRQKEQRERNARRLVRQWDEESFFAVVKEIDDKKIVEIVQELARFAKDKGSTDPWREAPSAQPRFNFRYRKGDKNPALFQVYKAGPEMRIHFFGLDIAGCTKELNGIGIDMPDDAKERDILLEDFKEKVSLEEFKKVIERAAKGLAQS